MKSKDLLYILKLICEDIDSIYSDGWTLKIIKCTDYATLMSGLQVKITIGIDVYKKYYNKTISHKFLGCAQELLTYVCYIMNNDEYTKIEKISHKADIC